MICKARGVEVLIETGRHDMALAMVRGGAGPIPLQPGQQHPTGKEVRRRGRLAPVAGTTFTYRDKRRELRDPRRFDGELGVRHAVEGSLEAGAGACCEPVHCPPVLENLQHPVGWFTAAGCRRFVRSAIITPGQSEALAPRHGVPTHA